MDMRPRSGGRLLVDALQINGVERVFCVPGESYLEALDALHDTRIEVITCRQEGGAAYMAEAHGKLAGKPGVCFVTRGPGATNASVGIHTAFQDSTPMIVFVGQVARNQFGREAFQELDYRHVFDHVAKWVVQIDDAARIPELVSQAFSRAMNGRPGPVVVALPEDMLCDRVTVADAPASLRVAIAPAADDLAKLQNLLSTATRPLMILGGGGWSPEAVGDIAVFAEAAGLPVATSFRCQDLFDNNHPNYAGTLGPGSAQTLLERVRSSDLLIVVGARLGEMTTQGFRLVEVPVPRQKLVHIHPGVEELGRIYQPAVAINATMPEFASAARSLVVDKVDRQEWVEDARAEFEKHARPRKIPGDVQLAEILDGLALKLPADAIVTNGAGNYAVWVHRFYRYRSFRTQLAPTNGSMGYGVPAAIAAKLQHPGRTVVSFAGDGCFLMNGQELATAVKHGANVVFVVVNNGMYGTIRMHQERNYPNRVTATELVNPDFVRLAEAYGLAGFRVTRTEEFFPAFDSARRCGRPALIEICISPEALTPERSLTQIREQAVLEKA